MVRGRRALRAIRGTSIQWPAVSATRAGWAEPSTTTSRHATLARTDITTGSPLAVHAHNVQAVRSTALTRARASIAHLEERIPTTAGPAPLALRDRRPILRGHRAPHVRVDTTILLRRACVSCALWAHSLAPLAALRARPALLVKSLVLIGQRAAHAVLDSTAPVQEEVVSHVVPDSIPPSTARPAHLVPAGTTILFPVKAALPALLDVNRHPIALDVFHVVRDGTAQVEGRHALHALLVRSRVRIG